MANALSYEEEQAILAGIKREAERIRKIEATAQKATADRFSEIYRKYPMLPPGVTLNMAKTGVSDQTIEKIATEIAAAANDQPDKMNGKKDGNVLHGFIKGVSRLGFAAFDTSKELFANAGSRLIGGPVNFVEGLIREGSQQVQAAQAGTPAQLTAKNVLDEMPDAPTGSSFSGSTTLATLIDNWENQGSGWFVSDEIRKEQAIRARAYRGVTNGGHAWTWGRGLAGVAFTEGSLGYNLMSGIIDGYAAVKIPVAPGVGKGMSYISELAELPQAGKGIVAAGKVTDTLLGRGTIVKVSDLTGEELRQARRLAGLIGDTVDPAEANAFFGTRGGRRLVERLVNANSYDDVRALVGRNVFADTIKRLRDAKTEFEVQEVLADVLGVPGKGLTRTEYAKGVRAFSLTNARRTKFLESLDAIPFGKRIKQFKAKTARNIGDISSENAADVRDTINAMDDWMRNSLVPEADWTVQTVDSAGKTVVKQMPGRKKMLDMAADALLGDGATPTAREALKDTFQDVVTNSLKTSGVHENVVDGVFRKFYDLMKKRQAWNKGALGEIDDAGFYNAVAVGSDIVTDGAFGGPMLASELARTVIDMPDPRQVRRLTGTLNGIWSKKGILGRYADDNLQRLDDAGQLRLLPAAATYLQQQIFKRLVLMTGGYTVRNLNEAQIRIALSNRNLDGVYNHPLSWISWAMGRKGKVDVLGEKFTADGLTSSMESFREGVQSSKNAILADPADTFRRGKRLGYFDEVERGNPEMFDLVVDAHGDEIGKLNADFVARLAAEGRTEDEIIDLIRNTEDGQKWFRTQQSYHMSGRKVYDRRTGRYSGVKQQVDLTDDGNLRHLVREINTRIEAHTGGDTRLKNIISSGQLPPETVVAKEVGILSSDVGNVVVIKPKGLRKTPRQVRVVSYDANTGEAVVLPFAFAKGEITGDLRALLRDDSVYYNPNMAPILRHEVRMERVFNQNGDLKAQWNDTVDQIFGFIYGKPSSYLDRSPVFRQLYYKTAVDDLLTSLSPGEAQRLLDNIEQAAQRYRTSAQRLLGGKERYERIQDAARGNLGMKSTLTLEEVDEIAKMNAVEGLKQLLYDASEQSNFIDAAGIVAPFANAFVDFFKSIGKAYTVPTRSGVRLPNIASLRKTQLVVQAGRQGDPDGDGRGFFFVDPETGEWSFTYPGSKWVVKTMTGLPGMLTAPISGALQGVDLGQGSVGGVRLNPGLGPWATMAASKVLDYVPAEDAMKRFWLPYGEPAFEGAGPGMLIEPFLPAWAKKAWDIATSSNESLGVRGNAFFDAKQANAASGKYDILNPDPSIRAQELLRLDKDSSHDAFWLATFRTAGQFLGPSRPTLEFKAKAMQGDVFINQMMADYRKWQLEDPDTATVKLFDIYGETLWPYLARKTTTEPFEGLTATKEVGKWEEKNNDLLSLFPDVAAYFAPVDGQFDWQVYTRQIIEKKRGKLRTSEAFDEAQWFAANSQYRYAEKMGLSEDELKNFKAELEQQYPGYKYRSFEVGKVEKQIENLQAMANLSRLDGNPAAEGLRVYFGYRDEALAQAAKSGKTLKAKVNSEIRDWLKMNAQNIAESNPEFKRLYERVLVREIEE